MIQHERARVKTVSQKVLKANPVNLPYIKMRPNRANTGSIAARRRRGSYPHNPEPQPHEPNTPQDLLAATLPVPDWTNAFIQNAATCIPFPSSDAAGNPINLSNAPPPERDSNNSGAASIKSLALLRQDLSAGGPGRRRSASPAPSTMTTGTVLGNSISTRFPYQLDIFKVEGLPVHHARTAPGTPGYVPLPAENGVKPRPRRKTGSDSESEEEEADGITEGGGSLTSLDLRVSLFDITTARFFGKTWRSGERPVSLKNTKKNRDNSDEDKDEGSGTDEALQKRTNKPPKRSSRRRPDTGDDAGSDSSHSSSSGSSSTSSSFSSSSSSANGSDKKGSDESMEDDQEVVYAAGSQRITVNFRNECIYFHTSITSPNVIAVVEFAYILRPESNADENSRKEEDTVSTGWTFFYLFNPERNGLDPNEVWGDRAGFNGESSETDEANTVPIYSGTPRILPFLATMTLPGQHLSSTAALSTIPTASLTYSLTPRADLRPVANYWPENVLVGARAGNGHLVPGIQFSRFRAGRVRQMKLCTAYVSGIRVGFRGGIREYEEELVAALLKAQTSSEVGAIATTGKSDAQQQQSQVPPPSILERRIHIGFHNTHTFMGDPIVTTLSSPAQPLTSLPFTSSFPFDLQHPAPDPSCDLVFTGKLSLPTYLPNCPLVALVIGVEYRIFIPTVTEIEHVGFFDRVFGGKIQRERHGVDGYERRVMVGWTAWIPHIDSTHQSPPMHTLELYAGPGPNPFSRPIYCPESYVGELQSYLDDVAAGQDSSLPPQPSLNVSFVAEEKGGKKKKGVLPVTEEIGTGTGKIGVDAGHQISIPVPPPIKDHPPPHRIPHQPHPPPPLPTKKGVDKTTSPWSSAFLHPPEPEPTPEPAPPTPAPSRAPVVSPPKLVPPPPQQTHHALTIAKAPNYNHPPALLLPTATPTAAIPSTRTSRARLLDAGFQPLLNEDSSRPISVTLENTGLNRLPEAWANREANDLRASEVVVTLMGLSILDPDTYTPPTAHFTYAFYTFPPTTTPPVTLYTGPVPLSSAQTSHKRATSVPPGGHKRQASGHLSVKSMAVTGDGDVEEDKSWPAILWGGGKNGEMMASQLPGHSETFHVRRLHDTPLSLGMLRAGGDVAAATCPLAFYLTSAQLRIDVWDATTLLPVGVSYVPLAGLVRAGRAGVVCEGEVDLLPSGANFTSAEGGAPIGRLNVRLANLARTVLSPGTVPLAALEMIKDAQSIYSASRCGFDDAILSLTRGKRMEEVISEPFTMPEVDAELMALLRATQAGRGPPPTVSDQSGHHGSAATGRTEELVVHAAEMRKQARAKRALASSTSDTTSETFSPYTHTSYHLSRSERQRDLQTIELFRARRLNPTLRAHLAAQQTVGGTLTVLLGQASYFHFVIRNPYNRPATFAAEWTMKNVRGVATDAEWNTIRQAYTWVDAAASKRQRVAMGSSPRVYLEKGEEALFPFVYQNFMPVHRPAKEDLSSGTECSRRRGLKLWAWGSEQDQNPELEYQATDAIKDIKISITSSTHTLSTLNLAIRTLPTPLLSHTRLFVPEREPLRHSLTVQFPTGVIGSTTGELHVRCHLDEVVCAIEKGVNASTFALTFKHRRPPSAPSTLPLYFHVYQDPLHLVLICTLLVTLHTHTRLDVTAIVGQTNSANMVIRGTGVGKVVGVWGDGGGTDVRIMRSSPFVLPAAVLSEVPVLIRPRNLDVRRVLVNVIDMDQHTLLNTWLIVPHCQLPPISKSFDMCVSRSAHQINKRISYTNPYPTSKTFSLHTPSPHLLTFKHPTITLAPNAAAYIGFTLWPGQGNAGGQDDIWDILVLLNDEEDRVEECLRISTTFS
ncbi:hypothetical protein DFS34DRAFT_615582 [Phlyctochytrium arcticum]|nr:hypothetical protein DFS34DRAFT_615582 [Phlyctochytrium arcticum]